jgi:hypothetical protein
MCSPRRTLEERFFLKLLKRVDYSGGATSKAKRKLSKKGFFTFEAFRTRIFFSRFHFHLKFFSASENKFMMIFYYILFPLKRLMRDDKL